MKIEFVKMSGAGNDFVVVDNRESMIKDGSKLARTVCDRRWGIGADGLLLLESTTKSSYRMMYYNADGSYGGMCGNGGRCLAYYAYLKNIAPKKHSFEALDFTYNADIDQTGMIAMTMKKPTGLKLNLVLPLVAESVEAHFIDTGSPHVVLEARKLRSGSKSLRTLNVDDLGKEIRHHKLFQPEGTNVNFIERDGKTLVRIRTYERGVEAETLACGTGSVAAAIIGSALWGMEPPVTIIPKSEVPLFIHFKREGDHFDQVSLRGPAIITFTGVIEV